MSITQTLTALGLLVATIGFGISVSLVKDSTFHVAKTLFNFIFAILIAIFFYVFIVGNSYE